MTEGNLNESRLKAKPPPSSKAVNSDVDHSSCAPARMPKQGLGG